ncbi:uncharacterized protein BJX67DRAFT_343438 [Aspergillus lucknowensis]|uniref:C2H2-type domain-containing protein n=1 Tax=Aspergillus lucknowensis TaxID=176173 RepID=A0ABR4M393_9EURO
MTPVAQGEVDMESHTSGMASQDSPQRRKFSEPIDTNSISPQTTPSPSPVSHRSLCTRCGKYFESSLDVSSSDALKKHIAAAHPNGAKHSTYDGTTDQDEESQIYEDDEHSEDEGVRAVLGSDSQRTMDSDDDDDDNVEGAEDELAEATEMYDDEKDRAEIEGDDAEPGGDGEVPEGESDVALSNQLHEFSREEDSASVDKRLHTFWNIHDVRKFSKEYDEVTAEMSATWTTVFHEPKRGKKRDAVELLERPNPYKKSRVGRGDFLEITPLEEYLAQLRDPEMRSSDELYAITENVAYALKVWQDEYLAIDKLQKLATRHNLKITNDPRKLERPQVFEDKKEAMLYGYKHDPKEDKVGNQNPFVQGGFKPTAAQYRKMMAKTGPNNPNPDGWPTITRFNVEHVPKFQNPPREDFVGKATRKRKAAELEASSRTNDSDEAGATDAPTPGEPDQDFVNPAKRRTRTRRQAAEAERNAEAGTARTSAARGRGGRARGRGAARTGSRAASETPLALAPTAAALTARSTPAADGSSQARSVPSQLVPIEPAPNGGKAAASTAKPVVGGPQDETLDPAELARRQKIANSKNPKRTEAMLNHWARFNREGRVRNPKRSKAQIEADRAAEAARKASEGPKPAGKKKKSESPSLSLPPRQDAGIAPAPPPMPAPPHLAPGPHTQTHQLPPIAAARGPLAPYPPPSLDPRAVAPFPPGPRGPGPLQQAPPPYRTPYPDYYIPYGAAALPPPGHPQGHPQGPPRPA